MKAARPEAQPEAPTIESRLILLLTPPFETVPNDSRAIISTQQEVIVAGGDIVLCVDVDRGKTRWRADGDHNLVS
jgi:hypothetical protein